MSQLRAIAERHQIALILLGGEADPDAELAELSTAAAGAVGQAFEYLRPAAWPTRASCSPSSATRSR